MKCSYEEGTVFVVPLRNGEFGVGLVTRMSPEGKIVLGYFFGPALKRSPELSSIHDLRPESAVASYRFGDLSLLNGEWEILGTIDSWDRSRWPMPAFIRSDPLSKKAFRVVYSDSDPNFVGSETSVPFGASSECRDAVLGAGAVEIVLTDLLTTES